MNRAAGAAHPRSKGIRGPVPFVAGDFDDPLREEFLLKAAGPVAIWDGEPKRTSIAHDGVNDEP